MRWEAATVEQSAAARDRRHRRHRRLLQHLEIGGYGGPRQIVLRPGGMPRGFWLSERRVGRRALRRVRRKWYYDLAAPVALTAPATPAAPAATAAFGAATRSRRSAAGLREMVTTTSAGALCGSTVLIGRSSVWHCPAVPRVCACKSGGKASTTTAVRLRRLRRLWRLRRLYKRIFDERLTCC